MINPSATYRNAVFLLLFFFISSCYEVENCKYTEGVIIGSRYYKKQYYYYAYEVDGIRYKNQEACYSSNIRNGEYYKVCYDSIEPSRSKLNFELPLLFEDYFNYLSTQGKITKVSETTVDFEYDIGNQTYSRKQYVQQHQFIKGEICTVLYREDKQSIGYLKKCITTPITR